MKSNADMSKSSDVKSSDMNELVGRRTMTRDEFKIYYISISPHNCAYDLIDCDLDYQARVASHIVYHWLYGSRQVVNLPASRPSAQKAFAVYKSLGLPLLGKYAGVDVVKDSWIRGRLSYRWAYRSMHNMWWLTRYMMELYAHRMALAGVHDTLLSIEQFAPPADPFKSTLALHILERAKSCELVSPGHAYRLPLIDCGPLLLHMARTVHSVRSKVLFVDDETTRQHRISTPCSPPADSGLTVKHLSDHHAVQTDWRRWYIMRRDLVDGEEYKWSASRRDPLHMRRQHSSPEPKWVGQVIQNGVEH